MQARARLIAAQQDRVGNLLYVAERDRTGSTVPIWRSTRRITTRRPITRQVWDVWHGLRTPSGP
jgi:hypothetical protein